MGSPIALKSIKMQKAVAGHWDGATYIAKQFDISTSQIPNQKRWIPSYDKGDILTVWSDGHVSLTEAAQFADSTRPETRPARRPTASRSTRQWIVSNGHAYLGDTDLGLLVNGSQTVKPTEGGKLWALYNLKSDGKIEFVGRYGSVRGAPLPPNSTSRRSPAPPPAPSPTYDPSYYEQPAFDMGSAMQPYAPPSAYGGYAQQYAPPPVFPVQSTMYGYGGYASGPAYAPPAAFPMQTNAYGYGYQQPTTYTPPVAFPAQMPVYGQPTYGQPTYAAGYAPQGQLIDPATGLPTQMPLSTGQMDAGTAAYYGATAGANQALEQLEQQGLLGGQQTGYGDLSGFGQADFGLGDFSASGSMVESNGSGGYDGMGGGYASLY